VGTTKNRRGREMKGERTFSSKVKKAGSKDSFKSLGKEKAQIHKAQKE
jgi:hypothetical protein